jgi:hypothetical protein
MKPPNKTRSPTTPTIKKEAGARQRQLDIAAQSDVSEGIRQGLEDSKFGRMRPAREVLEEFRRRNAIPRYFE